LEAHDAELAALSGAGLARALVWARPAMGEARKVSLCLSDIPKKSRAILEAGCKILVTLPLGPSFPRTGSYASSPNSRVLEFNPRSHGPGVSP
jgi:hypothetical protein